MKSIYEIAEHCEKEYFKILFLISCPNVLPDNSKPIKLQSCHGHLGSNSSNDHGHGLGLNMNSSKRSNSLPSINLSGDSGQLSLGAIAMNAGDKRKGRSAKEKAKIMNQNISDFEHSKRRKTSDSSGSGTIFTID